MLAVPTKPAQANPDAAAARTITHARTRAPSASRRASGKPPESTLAR
jgi:hypothetical protein